MQILGEKGLGKMLKIFLQICFYVGIVVLIALPFLLQGVGLHLGAAMYVIYPNGIVLLAITYEFIKLFESLQNDNPFSEQNVKILKHTSVISLIGSILWFMDFLFEILLAKSGDVVANMVCIFLAVLFLGVAIALYILSELLKQAKDYKDENDLTI